MKNEKHVVVQFYPCLKIYFLLFLGMVMYDNELEAKENEIQIKDRIEPQHRHNLTHRHSKEKRSIIVCYIK